MPSAEEVRKNQEATKVKRNMLHLPSPHSLQQQIYLNSQAPITACAWGTKAGKTFGSAMWLTRLAWEKGGGETVPYWWVAPVYRQSKIAIRLVKQFLPRDPNRVRHLKTDNRIEILSTNGEVHAAIEFRSADNPDHLQGDGLGGGVVDEADRMKRDSWESYLTTVTKTQAQTRVISSPKRRAWFYELCRRGMNLTQDQKKRLLAGDRNASQHGVFYLNCPTSINPYIKPEDIERMRAILPERAFRCYYLAEFPDSDGIIFSNVNAIFRPDLMLNPEPNPGEQYIVSLDLAKYGDYCVMLVGSVNRRQIVWALRWKDTSWEASWRRTISYAEHFNTADIIIDATTYGDPILESMQNSGTSCHVEGYNFTGKSKQPLIENLVLGAEKKDFLIPMDPSLEYAKEEMEIYEFNITEAGNIQYSAPEGQNDDFVSSLAMWYWHLTHRIMPGLRIFTPNSPSQKQIIAGTNEEEIAKIERMLKTDYADWERKWKEEQAAQLKQLMWGDN